MVRLYAAFALLGIFWGSNFIYMKWASIVITPGQISLLRVLFGFAPLAVFAWRKHVLRLDQMRYLHHFAMAKGTALLPSGIAGVIGASPALFTSVGTVVFLRHERMNALMAFGVLLGIVGIGLISRPWTAFGPDATISLEGVAWTLTGSIVFGLSYIYVRRYLSATRLPPLAIVTWQMGLALLMLLCLTDLHGIARLASNGKAFAGLALGLGLCGTGAAFLLYYYLLGKMGAVAASSAVYTTPIVALAIGWAAGERIGMPDIGAALLIFASIALLEFGRQASARKCRTDRGSSRRIRQTDLTKNAVTDRPPELQRFIDIAQALFARESMLPETRALATKVFERIAMPSDDGKRATTRVPACNQLTPALAHLIDDRGALGDLARSITVLEASTGWGRRTSGANGSDGYIERHVNGMIVGPGGTESRYDVQLGYSLLAPHTRYPDHRHPPEEAYVLLSNGEFSQNNGKWFDPGIGGGLHNTPNLLHAMRSGKTPLIAMWCLLV